MKIEEIKERKDGTVDYIVKYESKEERRIAFNEGLRYLREESDGKRMLDLQDKKERLTSRVCSVGIISALKRMIKHEQQ